MPDYGHDLLFGSFLTPTAGRPQHVLELAQLSEQIGLDLVTFQDHPYQPEFLDTWTVLATVAASTSRIRVAPNVANLPLRPPAVLARAAASLDLLSGGRVELGLGAGAFWDGIEAMGGRRLTPGQGVRALEEAIEIIRQVWDTDSRGGVRVDGEHHRVIGARRGPTPAHDVGIWVGAYKPRMLDLTGRLADGWLPSLPYLQPGDLTAGNAAVDAAATGAGRAPSRIRRLLNIGGTFAPRSRGQLHGPAEQWAEELADMALTEGISAFILTSDDPDDLRRYASEVAPAVRELVDSERAAGPTSSIESATPAVPPAVSGATPAEPRVTRSPLAVVATPDDGARRSDEQLWDESTRPTAPTRPPAGTYTAHAQAAAAQLVSVHDHLRSELTALHDVVEQVAAGEMDPGRARSHINEMTLRQNEWVLGAYCANYCRVVTLHHTLEDQGLFPHLRRAEPGLQPVLARLHDEHIGIHDVLERVDRALVEFVSTPDGMPALRAAVDLLTDSLLSHLSYEERELLEPIARHGAL